MTFIHLLMDNIYIKAEQRH